MGTSNILYQYQNGNTHVTILTDGTKIREYENIPVIIHPESIDVKITDYCTMGCKFCFTPETKILTVNGKKQISAIRIGDKVYAKDLNKNKIVQETVTNIFNRFIEEEIVKITLANNDIIQCTTNHKLYTKNRGWVMASELLITDDLENIF